MDNDMFTDYTNEGGEWRTVKDNGKDITLTVWTRFVRRYTLASLFFPLSILFSLLVSKGM